MYTLTLKCFRCSIVALSLASIAVRGNAATISGELKTWHTVTLTFEGPDTTETADPNPFTDYRLDVTFSRPGKEYVVPGYYAADGDAANTSAKAGNKWRVHFSPDKPGIWQYRVSFRQGPDLAVADDVDAGSSAGTPDGMSGEFEVSPTDKLGRDFRAAGRLEYVGERYQRFAGSGEYFLKCGVDAPENLLAYADFDGDFSTDGVKDELVKTWRPHERDWHPGDPTWQDGHGKGLIGVVNYLASQGLNAFSFITMNIGGDDRNVFPYLQPDDPTRFDISRLAQWDIVFEHAQRQGMFLHFKTQETENETWLDGGALGRERKLYYRELIARFSHHLALNWNMGEENGKWAEKKLYQSTEQRLAMARYFHEHDPYQHLLVIHNGQSFDDLLGPDSDYTGVSVQTNRKDFSEVHQSVLRYIKLSQQAGKPWVVSCDEPGDAQHSLVTDAEDPRHDLPRQNALWGTLLAGGQGVEWYFGYAHPHSDLTCQDFRVRENMWKQCRLALEFFRDEKVPFWKMQNADALLTGGEGYCLCLPDEVYLLLVKPGGTAAIDLSDCKNRFEVEWWNPRIGGKLVRTEVESLVGGEEHSLGSPPAESDSDWVVLLRQID